MHVSCTFASAILVTIRQLMMPSESTSAIACRSTLGAIIGRTPVGALSTASAKSAAAAESMYSTSLAQWLIVRSLRRRVLCACELVRCYFVLLRDHIAP